MWSGHSCPLLLMLISPLLLLYFCFTSTFLPLFLLFLVPGRNLFQPLYLERKKI